MSLFSRVLPRLASFASPLGFGRHSQARQSMSLICSGSVFRGAIESEGSLRVEGTLMGDVRVLGSIEVVKGAEIVGTELHCEELIISGRVESRVLATGSVTIVPGGRLQGDLDCGSLSIARGAVIRGQVNLLESGSNGSLQGSPHRTESLDSSPAGVDAFA